MEHVEVTHEQSATRWAAYVQSVDESGPRFAFEVRAVSMARFCEQGMPPAEVHMHFGPVTPEDARRYASLLMRAADEAEAYNAKLNATKGA